MKDKGTKERRNEGTKETRRKREGKEHVSIPKSTLRVWASTPAEAALALFESFLVKALLSSSALYARLVSLIKNLRNFYKFLGWGKHGNKRFLKKI
jgi:hypothetical protein